MSTIHARNHTLVVHFPSESRVRQLVRELKTDAQTEIIIVSDKIDALPFQEKNVSFVRGCTVSEENLSPSIDLNTPPKPLCWQPTTLTTTAMPSWPPASSVIDHLRPEIHLVAEWPG